jgi:hypothetical protein
MESNKKINVLSFVTVQNEKKIVSQKERNAVCRCFVERLRVFETFSFFIIFLFIFLFLNNVFGKHSEWDLSGGKIRKKRNH